MKNPVDVAIEEYTNFFNNSFPGEEDMMEVLASDVEEFKIVKKYIDDEAYKDASKAIWKLDTAPREFLLDVLAKTNRALYRKIWRD